MDSVWLQVIQESIHSDMYATTHYLDIVSFRKTIDRETLFASNVCVSSIRVAWYMLHDLFDREAGNVRRDSRRRISCLPQAHLNWLKNAIYHLPFAANVMRLSFQGNIHGSIVLLHCFHNIDCWSNRFGHEMLSPERVCLEHDPLSSKWQDRRKIQCCVKERESVLLKSSFHKNTVFFQWCYNVWTN